MSVADGFPWCFARVFRRPDVIVVLLFGIAGCGPTPLRVEEASPTPTSDVPAPPAVAAPEKVGGSESSATVETGGSAAAVPAGELPQPSPVATSSGPDAGDSERPAAEDPEANGDQLAAASNEPAVVDETDIESRPEAPDVPEQDDSGRYEFREFHDPDGIGKFYMGREIAWVMGFGAANWLERPEREREEATSQLLKALDLKQGMMVADIGAGSGVLSLPIAKRVAPRGKVYAVDVQQEMLDRLSGRARSRNIRNVEPVLGTEKSPRLKGESIELALMVDVYHEFAFPYEMMLEISKAMKPGGRVVFVEFRMEDPKVPIKLVHKMTEAQVKKEIELPEFRLKWKETIGTLPWQHVIVFEKQKEEGEEATKDADK